MIPCLYLRTVPASEIVRMIHYIEPHRAAHPRLLGPPHPPVKGSRHHRRPPPLPHHLLTARSRLRYGPVEELCHGIMASNTSNVGEPHTLWSQMDGTHHVHGNPGV